MLLDEVRVKSIDKLIELIDAKKTNKEQEKLVMNGNAIDAITLIKRYNLKPSERIQPSSYQIFKISPDCGVNEFATGPSSMYGNVIINLNIKGLCVQIGQSPRTNYESKFASEAITKYENQDYVVLDIETTGLDPLVDDIIQIGIYESNENKFVRYLPLSKKTKNTAKKINRISEATLKTKEPLSQQEVDEIIKQFNLEEKIIMIWSGENFFDRIFLEIYFKEHNLSGMEKFKFFNAKTLTEEFHNEIEVKDLSKDNLACLYGISCLDAHGALEDCKIEKEIICNLLNKNIEPLKAEIVKNVTSKIILFYHNFLDNLHKSKHKGTIGFSVIDSENASRMYYEFCDALKSKYGIILNDYDKNHKTRGAEWIDIHHIDEIKMDDIAVRTQLAQRDNKEEELKRLSKYNKHDRLVWANKIEHFILHALLDMIRCIPSGGLHFIFGDIIKLEIGIFEEGSKFFNLQKQKRNFYQGISFENIVDIYTTTCSAFGYENVQTKIDRFWNLKSYKYDEQKCESIMNLINEKLIQI